MSLKVLLTALFAISASAAPSQLSRRAGGKYLDDKEYELAETRKPRLGWCSFHIHEDWPTPASAAFGVSTRKVEMHLFDAPDPEPPALIYYHKQQDLSYLFPYEFPYDGLPHKLIISEIAGANYDGFEFEYNGEKFSTRDERHCQASDDHTTNNRKERDYDCGFTC